MKAGTSRALEKVGVPGELILLHEDDSCAISICAMTDRYTQFANRGDNPRRRLDGDFPDRLMSWETTVLLECVSRIAGSTAISYEGGRVRRLSCLLDRESGIYSPFVNLFEGEAKNCFPDAVLASFSDFLPYGDLSLGDGRILLTTPTRPGSWRTSCLATFSRRSRRPRSAP